MSIERRNAFESMFFRSRWLDRAMRTQPVCDISKSGLLGQHLLACKVLQEEVHLDI